MCSACWQLDAGVPEKVLLMSRDEQSMLVVSYADVKVGVTLSHCVAQGLGLVACQRSQGVQLVCA